jgi:hypothetical protein
MQLVLDDVVGQHDSVWFDGDEHILVDALFDPFERKNSSSDIDILDEFLHIGVFNGPSSSYRHDDECCLLKMTPPPSR